MTKALYVKGTDKLIAHVTEMQLRHLTKLLEEESSTDHDYYIDETVISYLTERGADKAVVSALIKALGAVGGRDEMFSSGSSHAEQGIEIEWREE